MCAYLIFQVLFNFDYLISLFGYKELQISS